MYALKYAPTTASRRKGAPAYVHAYRARGISAAPYELAVADNTLASFHLWISVEGVLATGR